MKYSMLSVAAFVASSLASPAYFWDQNIGPGDIKIDNKLNNAVNLDIVSEKSIDVDDFERNTRKVIQARTSYTIKSPPPNANLDLSEQQMGPGIAKVIYRSRGPEFRYRIHRISEHGRPPVVVHVRPTPRPRPPPQCKPLTLRPHDQHVGPTECHAGTRLEVILCRPGLGGDCPPRPPHSEYEAEWL